MASVTLGKEEVLSEGLAVEEAGPPVREGPEIEGKEEVGERGREPRGSRAGRESWEG